MKSPQSNKNSGFDVRLKRILSLVLSAAWAFYHGAAAEASPEKPNILFIAVDDLNDWNGVMKGNSQAEM